jgi:hypothetical protein
MWYRSEWGDGDMCNGEFSISTFCSHIAANSSLSRCPLRRATATAAVAEQVPSDLNSRTGATSSTAGGAGAASKLSLGSKPSTPQRSWRPFVRLREQCVVAFSIITGALAVMQSPLAWAGWAFTAYYVAVYGASMIGWPVQPLSSPLRALVLTGIVGFVAVGTWFIHDGLDPATVRFAKAPRAVLTAAVSELKHELSKDFEKLQSLPAPSPGAQNGHTGDVPDDSAGRGTTLQTDVKVRLAGSRESASVSVDATSRPEPPAAAASTQASRSRASAPAARDGGTSASSEGESPSGSGGQAEPAGTTPSVPVQGTQAAPDASSSEMPGEIPSAPSNEPSGAAPSEAVADPNEAGDGETPSGPILQTGGTPAP